MRMATATEPEKPITASFQEARWVGEAAEVPAYIHVPFRLLPKDVDSDFWALGCRVSGLAAWVQGLALTVPAIWAAEAEPCSRGWRKSTQAC